LLGMSTDPFLDERLVALTGVLHSMLEQNSETVKLVCIASEN